MFGVFGLRKSQIYSALKNRNKERTEEEKSAEKMTKNPDEIVRNSV